MEGEGIAPLEAEKGKPIFVYTIDDKECTHAEYDAALSRISELAAKYNAHLIQAQVVHSDRRDTAPYFFEGRSPDTKRMVFFKAQGTDGATGVADFDLRTLAIDSTMVCVIDRTFPVPNNPDKGSVEVVPLEQARLYKKWKKDEDEMLRIGNVVAPRVQVTEQQGKQLRRFTEKPFADVLKDRLDQSAISKYLAALDNIIADVSGDTDTISDTIVGQLSSLRREYMKRCTAIQAPGQFAQELRKHGIEMREQGIKEIVVTAFYHQLHVNDRELREVLPDVIHAVKNTLCVSRALEYARTEELIGSSQQEENNMRRALTDLLATSPELQQDIDTLVLKAVDHIQQHSA